MAEKDSLLTIDELAQASGMTVRTLRSHATRGLLPPPVMRGRVGFYGSSHLARLSFVREMQDAGFSLSSIEQILAGVPADAGDAMLGVIRALLAPWRVEPVAVYDAETILRMFGNPDPARVAGLSDLGIAELQADGRIGITAPGLLVAGAEAVAAGLPLDGVIEAGRLVVDSAQSVASFFVQGFRDSVWREFIDAGLPESEWERITSVHARLQPLAVQAFLSVFQRAMIEQVSQALGEELGSGAQAALQRLLGGASEGSATQTA